MLRIKTSFRQLFRQALPILCCCLFATAVTGITLGLGDRLLKIPEIVSHSLMAIHQGAFLGTRLGSLYILVIGLAVFVLGFKTVVQGGHALLSQQPESGVVNVYRAIALILLIPLVFCVEAGVAYRLGTDWFGLSSQQAKVFLSFHAGLALGKFAGFTYLSLMGLALAALSFLSWQGTARKSFADRQLRQTLTQSFRKDYLAQISGIKQNIFTSDKWKVIAGLSLIGILGAAYYFDSAILTAIAPGIIVLTVLVFIKIKPSVPGWQNQHKTQHKLYEQESASISMLKAIPDSLVRMTKDGICLSYMPAKEGTSFVLEGNIVDQSITKLVSTEIAQQLIESAQLSLQSGITDIRHFSTWVGAQEQHHEARISPIGEAEVLILVRDIADYAAIVAKQILEAEESSAVELLSESKLVETIDTTLAKAIPQNIAQGNVAQEDMALTQSAPTASNQTFARQILLCLTIEPSQVSHLVSDTAEDYIYQIAAQIKSSLPANDIFRLEDNSLILLIVDRTMEQASILVERLHQELNDYITAGQNLSSSSAFNISLLEVNPDNADGISLVQAAKATCRMAQQKVNFKTFW